MARCSMSDSSGARSPSRSASATMWPSSSVVAPPWISSTGSMPSARTRRFATLSNIRMTGPMTFRYASVGPASRTLTRSGSAMPQFLGISSPRTICTPVAMPKPSTRVTAVSAPEGRPRGSSAGERRAPSAGWAMKPTSSVVMVMPSCAPESMNDRRRVTLSARPAPRSPDSERRRSSARSAATYANSWATKKPVPTVRTTTASMPKAADAAFIGHPPERRRADHWLGRDRYSGGPSLGRTHTLLVKSADARSSGTAAFSAGLLA